MNNAWFELIERYIEWCKENGLPWQKQPDQEQDEHAEDSPTAETENNPGPP